MSPIPGMPVFGQDLVPSPQFWGPPSDLEQAPLQQGWFLHWALGLLGSLLGVSGGEQDSAGCGPGREQPSVHAGAMDSFPVSLLGIGETGGRAA